MPNGDENELSPVTDVNLMDPNDHDATLLKPPGSINHLTTHKFYISSKPRKNFNLTQQPIQAVKQMERTAEKNNQLQNPGLVRPYCFRHMGMCMGNL